MSEDLRPARAMAAAISIASLGFGLPLFVDPYRWARTFTWAVEEETDEGLYFGRCLGGVAIAAAVHASQATTDPRRHASVFTFAEAAGWLLAAVHVRGAIERRQPVIETVEIAGWTAMALGARRFRPRSG
jgi:hypothetical protein